MNWSGMDIKRSMTATGLFVMTKIRKNSNLIGLLLII